MLIVDFFCNLFDMVIEWKLIVGEDIYEGCDCWIGELKWIGMCVDLVFGLNVVLWVLFEVYVSVDGEVKFICDFVVVWVKVMNFD